MTNNVGGGDSTESSMKISKQFPPNPFSKRILPTRAHLQGMRAPSPVRFAHRDHLATAGDLWDIRKIASRRAPKAVFDYVDGGSGSEITLKRQRDTFARIEFIPRVLVDISHIDTSTTILGMKSDWPFAFGPTGFTRMMHHEGEVAVGRVASRNNIVYALSTLGTTSLKDLASCVPDGRKMFQLYIWRDRAFSRDLLAQAKEFGYDTVILTVDTPVAGLRLRDVRNGLAIPPKLSTKTLIDISLHPRWWFNLLTTSPLEFASLSSTGGTVADLVGRVFDPSLSLADLVWLRENWQGHIIVKGIQSLGDAVMVSREGANGILLSNHGGRQLDRAPVPLELLPKVVQELAGASEVYIDGGVMSGGDIVAALALGAKAVFLGRAYLYGLMADGEAGVSRVVEILKNEIKTQLSLMGVPSLAELKPEMIRYRD